MLPSPGGKGWRSDQFANMAPVDLDLSLLRNVQIARALGSILLLCPPGQLERLRIKMGQAIDVLSD